MQLKVIFKDGNVQLVDGVLVIDISHFRHDESIIFYTAAGVITFNNVFSIEFIL